MIRTVIIQYLSVLILHSLGSSMIASTYVTYLSSHGLNLFEVNMVNFCFFLTLFLAEIPTGAFADIYGRKASYVVACFITALGVFLYSMATTFWGFIACECIIAIGMTFASGAFQAWLVDSLKHHGYEGKNQTIFAHAAIWPKLASILGAIIGAQCATSIGMRAPWIIEGCIAILEGILVMCWLKEEYFEKKKFSFTSNISAMKKTVRDSFTYGVQNKPIRFLLAVGIIQTLCTQAPNMQWQLFFKPENGDTFQLGYMFAAIMAGLMGGSYLAKYLTHRIKNEKKALIWCQVCTGVFLAITALYSFPVSACLFVLHEIPRGMYGPVKEQYLHDNIPSHARATVSSFESMTPHLGGMIGLLCSGALAQTYGIATTWICSGVALVLCTLLIGQMTRQK